MDVLQIWEAILTDLGLEIVHWVGCRGKVWNVISTKVWEPCFMLIGNPTNTH